MNASETVAYWPNVDGGLAGTTKLRWRSNFGAYRLAEDDMATGSLLGSPALLLKLKATGAIGGLYSNEAGKTLLGTFLLKHWDETTGIKLDPLSGSYFLYPAHQGHEYLLSNGVKVVERVFLDLCSRGGGYYAVEFVNESEEAQRIATFAFCELGSGVDDALEVAYDRELQALTAYSREHPAFARVVGASRAPRGFETSVDPAMSAMPVLPGPLSGEAGAAGGAEIGTLRYSTLVEPGGRADLVFRLVAGTRGIDDARARYAGAPDARRALKRTQGRYRRYLSRAVASTPHPEIGRGVLWAKANMLRVMSRAPQGWGFPNDPMRSNHCVARDAAWFCAGADYFRPAFSRRCLAQFFDRQRDDGLLPEYFDLIDGSTEDFGLNVNDGTPLLLWATWRHCELTADDDLLERTYPRLLRAARYLASQRNGDGLVWCSSRGTGSYGIVGWRNVVQNGRVSGAVTEVNCETYAAFRAVAALARRIGDASARAEFEEAATRLKDAIAARLFNPGNGLYYLNIDVDGRPRSDITADLLFPVLFGVADRETAERVLRRLSDRDFWTPGGMRTIPHDAIDYTPDGASGCLGGVWNGVTFWYAKAAAPFVPDFAAEALRIGFENYARDPQRNNTVPGQFSEWLHGQTLVNGGMPLSPWFPPRYVWAVTEGLLGFDPLSETPRADPHLPPAWGWCALAAAPCRGESVTWFAARVPQLKIWSTRELASDAQVERLSTAVDVACSGDDAVAVALREGSRIVVLIGNTGDRSITTALRVSGARGVARGRRYDSLSQAWTPFETQDGELARGLPAELAPKGFQVLELTAK